MGKGAATGYEGMTPRDVELYRFLSLPVRIFFRIEAGLELMFAPVSMPSGPGFLGEGAGYSSEAIQLLNDIIDERNASKTAYDVFREKYPDCNVGLDEFRCACKYRMSRVPNAQPDAEQQVEIAV